MRGQILTVLVIVVLTASAFAATIHVPDDYSGIQAAIDASTNGDSIVVAPGLYSENIDFLGKAVKLVSLEGSDATFIEPATTTVPIVSFNSGEDSNTVMAGFTLRNNTNHWGVVFSSSGGVVQNCEIHNCSYGGQGAGIACINAAARIRNNRIHDNFAGNSGAGIGITGTGDRLLEITGNEIYNNGSPNHGPGISCLEGSNILIAYNILYGNSGSGQYAGAIYIWGNNMRIINNTIVGNTRGISMAPTGGIPCYIYNNIVVGNDDYGISPAGSVVDYNNDWDNGSNGNPGPNGISADPQFLDEPQNDYRLNDASPCINAGHPDAEYNDPDGTRNDMGAIPFGDLAYPLAINFSPDPGAIGNVVTVMNPLFSWEYLDTAMSTQTAFEIEVGTDNDWNVAEMWQTGMVMSTATSIEYAGASLDDHYSYFIRIRLYNSAGAGSWQYATMITRYSSTVQVPGDFPTIAAGISASVDGDTLLIAAGTYTGSGNRDLDFNGKQLVLMGAGSDSTIIDCQGTPTEPHRAFWVHSDEDTTTVIKNLRIINGVASAGGAILCSGAGLTVEGVVCESNAGEGDFSSGGAIGVGQGNIVLIDCRFLGNSAADYGGALYCHESNVRAESCLFKNNLQNSGMGCIDFESGGGAVYGYESRIIFDSCTFEKNMSYCGVYDIDIISNCSLFVDNSTFIGWGNDKESRTFWGAGDVKAYYNTYASIENSLFIENDGYPVGGFGAYLSLTNCTITDCYGGVYHGPAMLTLTNCLIAYIGPGQAVYIDYPPEPATITCSNFWENDPGPWQDSLEVELSQNNNVSINPLFCDPANNDYSVAYESYCLPENNPCNALIGWGTGGCDADFICGDADADGAVAVTDAVHIINYVFAGGAPPNPPLAADVNCSGSVSVTDAVYVISYIFAGGPEPCAACP